MKSGRMLAIERSSHGQQPHLLLWHATFFAAADKHKWTDTCNMLTLRCMAMARLSCGAVSIHFSDGTLSFLWEISFRTQYANETTKQPLASTWKTCKLNPRPWHAAQQCKHCQSTVHICTICPLRATVQVSHQSQSGLKTKTEMCYSVTLQESSHLGWLARKSNLCLRSVNTFVLLKEQTNRSI